MIVLKYIYLYLAGYNFGTKYWLQKLLTLQKDLFTNCLLKMSLFQKMLKCHSIHYLGSVIFGIRVCVSSAMENNKLGSFKWQMCR